MCYDSARMSSGRATAHRWMAIDQTRGAAMVLVWFSHFVVVYFPGSAYPPGARAISIVTKAASPTFVILSGILLGWFTARDGPVADRIRLRFLDRGVFLLTVAHLVIWAAHIARAGSPARAARVEFMTDTIGLCLIAGPLAVRRLSAPARVATGLALLVGSWATLVLHHGDPPGGALGELVVGSLYPDDLDYTFPVLPWAGVFLASTAMGERFHALRARGLDRVARVCWLTAAGLFASAAPTWLVHRAASGSPALWDLTRLGQKAPPGPGFIALFGGCAFALLATFLELERRGWVGRAGRLLATIGRCSLFAFVAQYAVYYTALELLRPSLAGPSVLWLAASIGLLAAATAAWDAMDGNRWLTVGILRPLPLRAPSPGPPDAAPGGP